MNTNITELDEIKQTTTSQIRRGGKQKSGKCPLKHTNMYFRITTGLLEATDENKAKLRDIVSRLTAKIEEEFLIMQGSDQGLNQYNLKKDITREEAWTRIEGNPVVKYFIDCSQKNIVLHYLYAVAKRALDTQIENLKVINFIRSDLQNADLKSYIYRDSRKDINAYIQK